MTKREYFNEIDNIVRAAIAAMNFHADDAESVKKEIDSGKYTRETKFAFSAKRSGILAKIQDENESAITKITNLSADFRREIEASNRMKGEELTEDAKLLGVGVTLSAEDIAAMFDRNAGNPTMEHLICRYADQHGIALRRVPSFKGSAEYDIAGIIPTVCKYILRNYTSPAMYHETFGEGSEYRKMFTADAE